MSKYEKTRHVVYELSNHFYKLPKKKIINSTMNTYMGT